MENLKTDARISARDLRGMDVSRYVTGMVALAALVFLVGGLRARYRAQAAENKPDPVAFIVGGEVMKPTDRISSSNAVLTGELVKRQHRECDLIWSNKEIPSGPDEMLCGISVVHVRAGHGLLEYRKGGEERQHPRLVTRRGNKVYYWRIGASPGTLWEVAMVFQEHPVGNAKTK